jgi:hypothetical protein
VTVDERVLRLRDDSVSVCVVDQRKASDVLKRLRESRAASGQR